MSTVSNPGWQSQHSEAYKSTGNAPYYAALLIVTIVKDKDVLGRFFRIKIN